MKKNDFKKDLEIDLENLEVEACLQPELFYKYSRLAADAREEQDHAKLQVEIMEAKLCRKARANPHSMGVRKITNEGVKEAVHVHPDYIEKYKEWIKAKSNAEKLYGASNSMEQRKRMLELLVQLQGREYFASPSAPHTPKHFWKEIKRKKGEKTHEKMTKKSRKRRRKK